MSAPTAPAAAAPASAAVRKNVTALFADLVGSTSFGEQVDPEAARSSMAGYFELLRSTIEDHAGTVVKFTGDGVMAVFGVPEVAEDDALRAVAAGQALQGRFRAFADQVRDRHGVELGLRVGVNTGELVIGDDDADMVGDVLNTAARLEAACQPGRVMVGEDTWRLTRSSVTYEVLGEVRVKGKAEALATFQVVDGAEQSVEDVTPFVGRQEELVQLHAVFDDAVASSMARLVTVIGAPGVGKTRLASELRGSADVRSFDLRFERRGSTTFTPIVELLRELTGSGTAEDVERLVAEHPEAARLAPVLASFLGHGEARSTEESFWAVRRLLELLASDAPLIVVVDDIQWAEPLFWDLLDHLVEWTEAPVLLVALARPELRELRPELAQAGRRVAASISVEGLDAATTRELAARLLDTDELPSDLIDRLPDSTEGNPLFVRELVQMLVDDGVLARTGDTWHLTIDVDAIEVPPTILSLLASRVERLPDDERQVVELASVIGTEFDRGTLGAIAGSEVASRLGALIDRLRRKDLIEPSGSWAGDHPVYRFHHVLVRDAAYRRLLKGHRADLHEQVGRHVEGLGDVTDEFGVVIAFHYEQVHGYRSELGTVDEATLELAAQATSRLQSAAEQALAREDLPSAGGYALRALALVSIDADTERDELLLLGCEALLSSGDVARGGELVEEMRERASDERLSAWAECFRAQLWSLTDPERLTEASEITDTAAARLAELGDDAGVAKARLVRAGCLARLGRVGDCEEELDLALGAARAAGDRRRTVAVLGAAPLAALWGPSPVARAGGRCLDVLRLLRITTASPAVEATSIRCQGMLEALRGRFDSAREKFETSRATARELGLRQGLYETELFAGIVELLAGDPIAAEPHLRLAQEGLGKQGIAADAGQASARLARSLLRQGRIDEADGFAVSALETAGQNLQTAIAGRAVLAEIRAEQGEAEEAERLITEAIEIAERTDLVLDHALTLLAAVRVAEAAGSDQLRAARSKEASELLERKGATVEMPSEPATVTVAAPEQPSGEDHETTFTNQAWELQLRAAQLFGSPELRSLLSDRFESREHTRIRLDDAPMTGDQFVELMVETAERSGDVSSTPELIAIRGEDLCLSKLVMQNDDDERTSVCVIRSDGQLAVSVDWYDEDQLQDAYNELDRQHLLSQGVAPESWLVEHWHRAYAVRAEDILPILHPDLEFTDRRRYIGRAGGVADLLAGNDMGFWATDVAVPRIPRVSERGAVLERIETVLDQPGDVRNIMVIVFADDRIRWIDVFDPDDLEAALARYDELTRPAPEHPRRELTNHAWELSQRTREAFAAGDRETLLTLYTEDYIGVLHEQWRTIDTLDREAHIDMMIAALDALDLESEVLAVRGEALYLASGSLDLGESVVEMLFIGESRGDQTARADWYSQDQLDEAIAELDRRWLSGSGLADDSWVVRNWHLSTHFDLTGIADDVHPEFSFVDHRSLHVDLEGDVDELNRQGTGVNAATSALVTMVHRLSEAGGVFERVEQHELGDIPGIFVVHQVDDALARLEFFEPEHLDTALALFEELVSGESGRVAQPADRISNTAFELSTRLAAALTAVDVDAVDDLIHEEFGYGGHRWTDLVRDSASMPRPDLVKSVGEWGEMFGVAEYSAEAIAVRGDDLSLQHAKMWIDDDLVDYLFVTEVADGQISHLVTFDEHKLDEAIAELDRRYLESLGFGGEHWIAELWPAIYASGPDELAASLHPDWEYIEHRRLSYADTDTEGFMEIIASRDYEMQVSAPAIHRLSERGIVFERYEAVVGAIGEYDTIAVSEFVDELVRRTDVYEADDLDAALARYEEITATASTGQAVTNRAERSAREAIALVVRDGIAAHSHRFSPEFITENRRRRAWPAVHDVASAHDSMEWVREQGVSEVDVDSIAVRGEILCLQRWQLTFDNGDEFEQLMLSQLDDQDRVAVGISYDLDQLADALDELDRLWLSTDPSPYPIDMVAYNRRFREIFAHGTVDELHAHVSPDLVSIDHRPLGMGTRDADTWVDSTRDLVGRSEVTITEVLDHHGPLRLSRAVFRNRDDGSVLVDGVGIADNDDHGRLSRMDLFAADQLDAARRRFDELVRQTSGRNQAVRLLRLIGSAWEQRDLDFARALLHPDYQLESRRATRVEVPVDAEAFVAIIADTATNPDGLVSTQRLIASRGDELCLAESIDRYGDSEMRFLTVAQTLDGQVRSTTLFDDDQLHEALDELDRQWVETGGPQIAVMAEQSFRHTFAGGTAVEMGRMCTPDFIVVDHRPLGMGIRSRQQWVESTSMLAGVVDMHTPEYLGVGDHATLCRVEMRSRHDGSSWSTLVLNQYRGELVAQMEEFSPENRDAALARFDEVTAESPTEPKRLTNGAMELGLAMTRAHDSSDRALMASMLADDFVAVVFDPIMRTISEDGRVAREDYLDIVFADDVANADSTTTATPVAVRGEDLCINRMQIVSGSGDLTERLVLGEYRDDRCIRLDHFGPNQLQEAQIELDRRWFASLGYPPDHPYFELVTIAYSPSVDAMAQMISPNFEYVEHRRLGFPDGGRDQMLTNTATQFAEVELVNPRHLRVSDRMMLLERSERTVDGSAENSMLSLVRLDHNGQIDYMELFDPDDDATAVARYDELMTDEADPGLSNRCVELGGELRQAVVSKDTETLDRLLSPEFVSENREHTRVALEVKPLDKAEYVRRALELHDLGEVSIRSRLVAIRDSNLALTRETIAMDDNEHELLVLAETSGTQIERLTWFDETQLHEALYELGDRWLASGGPPEVVHFERAIRAAFRAGSGDPLRPVVTDDFVRVDHRHRSSGDWTIDEFIGSLVPLAEVGGADIVVSEVFDATSRGHVAKADFRAADATWELLGVHVHEGELTSRLELFGVVDLEQARARLRELVGDVDDQPGAAPPPTNRGSRCVEAFVEALVAGDRERMIDLMTPDFRAVAHYRYNVGQVLGPDVYVDETLLQRARGAYRVNLEVVAVRDDDLCLIRSHQFLDDYLMEHLIIVRAVDDRLASWVMYDETQLHEALDELDRQWVELGGSAAVAAMWKRWRASQLAGDIDQVQACLTGDFVDVDHRPLGKGTRQRQEYLSSMGPLTVLRPLVFPVEIVEVAGDTALVQARMQVDDADAEWDLWAVTVYRDGLMQRNESFGIDQFDQAQARFDELAADETGPGDGLSNRETELTEAFGDAWAAGTVDVADFVEPGFVFAGRRNSTPAIDGGAEVLESIVEFWSEQGLQRTEHEVLAIRGDDIALSRDLTVTKDGDELSVLFVSQVGESGRWCSTVAYDTEQLAEAQIELDRMYLTSLGYPEGHFLQRLMPVAYSLDPSEMASVLHPDLEYIEHRPLTFEGGDGGQLITNVASIDFEAHVVIPVIHRISERATVWEKREVADSGVGETAMIIVATFEDELARAFEIFEPDDLDAALARYDDLVSTAPSETPRTTNPEETS